MSVAIKVARAGSQGGIPAGRRVSSGDPGLFGFLRGAVRTVGSLLTGGPVAAAQTAIRQVIRPGVPQRRIAEVQPNIMPASINLPLVGPPGVGLSFRESASASLGAGVAAKGYHLNKSAYFLRDGTFIPEGTRMVKNRRRNALNVKALRRAVGRIDAGKVWQGKLAEISTAKYTAAGKHKHHH